MYIYDISSLKVKLDWKVGGPKGLSAGSGNKKSFAPPRNYLSSGI